MRNPRVNHKIRSNEVQLITHEGENIGIVPIGEAMMNCILLDHYLMNKAQCG